MFRHYRVILRQLVINTLPSYSSISNAAVGNTIYNYPLMPNDLHMRRTAQLTFRRCILYIYSTNTRTKYFKNAA